MQQQLLGFDEVQVKRLQRARNVQIFKVEMEKLHARGTLPKWFIDRVRTRDYMAGY